MSGMYGELGGTFPQAHADTAHISAMAELLAHTRRVRSTGATSPQGLSFPTTTSHDAANVSTLLDKYIYLFEDAGCPHTLGR